MSPTLPWRDMIAGVVGGMVPTLLLHPLDLVKVRLQVAEGKTSETKGRPRYDGFIHAIKSIARTDGIRGLYQGVTPNILGNAVAWGSYFFVFKFVKQFFTVDAETKALAPWQHMAAATQAGVVTLAITNPIWVAKTRMCLRYTHEPQYASLSSTFRTIVRTEGVTALYRGFLVGLIGISHGVIQFSSYEQMKTRYNLTRGRDPEGRLNTAEYLTFAACSKVLAVFLTYPYQVVRSRLQEQHRHYNGVKDVVKQVVTHEGVAGFYKGLFPAVLRVTPACCITFIIYEQLSHFLS